MIAPLDTFNDVPLKAPVDVTAPQPIAPLVIEPEPTLSDVPLNVPPEIVPDPTFNDVPLKDPVDETDVDDIAPPVIDPAPTFNDVPVIAPVLIDVGLYSPIDIVGAVSVPVTVTLVVVRELLKMSEEIIFLKKLILY